MTEEETDCDAEDEEALYDADPDCEHEVEEQRRGGVKCKHCPGWFCY